MKIEIGKRYWRRDGILSGVIDRVESNSYPYFDSIHCKTYQADGRYIDEDNLSPFDLVEFYLEPSNESYIPAAPTEATKHDQGKPRYDLLPADALDQIAQVFTFGAAKYADRNWEGGMAWGRLFAALMRHCWAFWRGEELDPETGYHHLAHAGACVLMLLASVTRGAGTDDRGEKNELGESSTGICEWQEKIKAS